MKKHSKNGKGVVLSLWSRYIRVADEDKQMSPDELEDFIIRKREQTSNWDPHLAQV